MRKIAICVFVLMSICQKALSLECGADPASALNKHIEAHIAVDAVFISECTAIESIRDFNDSDLARAVPISKEDHKILFNIKKEDLAKLHARSEQEARDFFRRFYLAYWNQNSDHIRHKEGKPVIIGVFNEEDYAHVLYRYEKHIGQAFRFTPKVVSFKKSEGQFIAVDRYLFTP